jgi:hypothetical protein
MGEGITGFDVDNQRIARAHNEILAQLVKAIQALTEAVNNSNKNSNTVDTSLI